MSEEFGKMLGEWKEDQVREQAEAQERLRNWTPPPPPPEFPLTQKHKLSIVKYCVNFSDGMLEDDGEQFCNNRDEPDWRAVSRSCEDFMDRVRDFVTRAIKEGRL